MTRKQAIQIVGTAALATALAPVFADKKPPEAPALRLLARGSSSQATQPQRLVVRDEKALAAVWKLCQQSPLPPVDFDKEMVLAVFLGSKPTGGFDIEVRAAKEEKGKLVVTVAERKPGPDTIVTQAFTSPYHLVAAPRSALEVKWKTVDWKAAEPKGADPR